MSRTYWFKLIKSGMTDWIIPDSTFIKVSSTPEIIQDSDAYRDGLGELHRDTLSHKVAKFVAIIAPMYEDASDAFIAKLNSYIVDANERKVRMQYWNKWKRTYETGDFYVPDVTFTTLADTDSGVLYEQTELHFDKY